GGLAGTIGPGAGAHGAAGGWRGADGSGGGGREGVRGLNGSGHGGVLLFVAKGGDGVESSRLARRPDSEHDPDDEAEEGGDGHRSGVDGEAPAGDAADERGDRE